MFDLTVAAAAVASWYAPPLWVFLHDVQLQMPTTWRFTLSLPQKTHVYCTRAGAGTGRSGRS